MLQLASQLLSLGLRRPSAIFGSLGLVLTVSRLASASNNCLALTLSLNLMLVLASCLVLCALTYRRTDRQTDSFLMLDRVACNAAR